MHYMKKPNLIAVSLINASATFVYVFLIAWMMFNAKTIFGDPPSFFIPLFVILLFVISATITGLLVLGKPVHLYMGGFKKEAFTLLFATLAWLIIFLLVVVITLLLQ